MFAFLRRHLRFANVVSLLALFVALGGSSYAALRINGSQLKNRSVSGKKLKRNTLGGRTIKESRLGKVRRARNADRVGGKRARDLKVRCPANLIPVSGVCAERFTRQRVAYGGARIECDSANRRLPTYEELANLVSGAGISVAPGGELTSNVLTPSASAPGAVDVVTVTSEAGGAGRVPDTFEGGRAFRCVAYPRN